MMDRDGRLLETWGGRRGWNSSSCFYLLHTRAHRFLRTQTPGCLACAHSPNPSLHARASVHARPRRHVFARSQGLCLSEVLEHAHVSGGAGCFYEGVRIYFLPSMICLHLLLSRPFAKNPLSILLLCFSNIFCSFADFCWLAEN